MLRHVLITLMIIHKHSSSLVDYENYFSINDYQYNETTNCRSLESEQFYFHTENHNFTLTRLECLPENLDEHRYFPKCCPPNFVYQSKDHKCIRSNFTNIYEDLDYRNVLIRTDLFGCEVILDHVLDISQQTYFIDSNRSLYFEGKKYELGSYCLDKNNEKEYFVVRTCETINKCKSNGVKCIKKCCPDGQYYEGNKCQPGHQFGLSLENITRFEDQSENFNAILVSGKCVRHLDKPHYKFYIKDDGRTVIRELGVWKQYTIEENYYCVEYVRKAREYKLLLCTLFDTNINASKPIVNQITLTISCVCLMLTLASYLILPDLKNFIGRIIICYCSCLLIAFSSLTWIQFEPTPGDYCDVFGFIIAFFFLAAFSWMTILSYEMWRVLGSMTVEYGNKLLTHRKRFIWYNIVGWTIPLAITTFTLLDYLYYFLPNSIHIVVGYKQCVFENQRSRGMYGYTFHFAVPCGLYLLINFVIFIKTIKYIYQVKNEINHIKVLDNHEKRKKWMILDTDKERLKMVVRIFLVMGINFLFETFSSIFVDFSESKALEITETIVDAFNCLQGVFIFCIFLLKKKIWKSMRELAKWNKSSRKSSVATTTTEVTMIHRNQV